MNTLVQSKSLPANGTHKASTGMQVLMSSARAAVALCLVTGVAYPLATTVVAQLALPHQAAGSLIERDGRVVGSALVGQAFEGAKYFQGRPSATTGPDPANPEHTISQPYNPLLSAGSNQGATNSQLASDARERAIAYRQANRLHADALVPVDAVTASASGLDPHISVANARLQTARVAAARNLSEARVAALVDAHTAQRALWVLGEPRVNVLQLNLALDDQAQAARKE